MKGKPEKIFITGIKRDNSAYLYYVDADGDVCRAVRGKGYKGRNTLEPLPKFDD